METTLTTLQDVTEVEHQQSGKGSMSILPFCKPHTIQALAPTSAIPDKTYISWVLQFRALLTGRKLTAVNYNSFQFSHPSQEFSQAAAPLTGFKAVVVPKGFRLLQSLKI